MIKLLKIFIPTTLKISAKKILGKYPAGRSINVRDTDIFIVSYPKSGNTWTRFLIGNLIYEEGVDFANIENRVPDIYANSNAQLDKLPSPRYLKSHEYFDPRYKKVIYIVRDPRDVAVSYWHFAKKQNVLPENSTLVDFIEFFTQGKQDEFGSWGENVGSWLGARENNKDFLLLRYEDLLTNPIEELRRVAHFASLPNDENRIKRAIELSSFDRMQHLEKSQGKHWKAIRNSNQNLPFVRSGKSGGWKNSLSEQDASAIRKLWGPNMGKLEYLR